MPSGEPSRAVKNNQSARSAAVDTAAVRLFVEGFYQWYVPLAHKEGSEPAWYVVLGRRPLVLSDSLLDGLKRDRASQGKATGEIAGIDFDPFLAAQDPCERYVTGDFVRTDSVYGIDVYGVCGGSRRKQADLVALLSRRDTSWVFVDFEYPKPTPGHVLDILAKDDSAGTPK